MSEGRFTVEPDGSLAVDKRDGKRAGTLDGVLSTFAEPIHTAEPWSYYRVTSASIWKARRQGFSLADIIQALETHCETEIPESLRADVQLWSQQIDRLWLETDEGRLVLRSHNPLLMPTVQRHRTLRRFIKQKIAADTLELRAELEPELMQAFDDAQYPILDRRAQNDGASAPHRASSGTASAKRRRRRARRSKGRLPRETETPKLIPARVPLRASVQTDNLFDMFRSQLANRCEATTRVGRQCKNRVRPPRTYCRVHRHLESIELDNGQTPFSHDSFKQWYETGLISVELVALFRVGIGVVIGLSTWLLNTLLMWVGVGWLGLPLASWYTVPIVFFVTCWIVSIPLGQGGLGAVLLLILVSFLSILMDFLNKDGLILNICYVLIPFVLPVYLLYRYSLSGWWGLLFVPLGLFIGWLFYRILNDPSE